MSVKRGAFGFAAALAVARKNALSDVSCQNQGSKVQGIGAHGLSKCHRF